MTAYRYHADDIWSQSCPERFNYHSLLLLALHRIGRARGRPSPGVASTRNDTACDTGRSGPITQPGMRSQLMALILRWSMAGPWCRGSVYQTIWSRSNYRCRSRAGSVHKRRCAQCSLDPPIARAKGRLRPRCMRNHRVRARDDRRMDHYVLRTSRNRYPRLFEAGRLLAA